MTWYISKHSKFFKRTGNILFQVKIVSSFLAPSYNYRGLCLNKTSVEIILELYLNSTITFIFNRFD